MFGSKDQSYKFRILLSFIEYNTIVTISFLRKRLVGENPTHVSLKKALDIRSAVDHVGSHAWRVDLMLSYN